MVDPHTQARIQELFRRENRSFLQYISAAAPWVGANDKPLVEKINRHAAEERAALEKLALWMESKRIALPYLGAFPTRFSSFNFVDIRKLLKPLIVEQRKELADLEAEANSIADDGAMRQIAELAELNRKHLGDLEQLTQPLAA